MRRGDWAHDPQTLQRASRSGAIRVATLEELGVPPRTSYRRCLPGGPWQRLLPGVVLLTNMPPTRLQLVEAALLYGGQDTLVTGLEACQRHGLRNLPDSYGIHLLVPAGRHLHSTGNVVVERTKRFPKPVVRDGVPLAPPVRAVIDACRRLTSRDPVQALITEAVQRGRVPPAWLSLELAAGSRRGTAVPRDVLRDVIVGARSDAEVDAIRVWERTGLPRPAWNVPLRDTSGTYLGTPDAWFAEVGLAWEIDSYEFHFEREAYANTVNRNARYAGRNRGVADAPDAPAHRPRRSGGGADRCLSGSRGSRPPPAGGVLKDAFETPPES
ncbi:hypothetical protein [Actinophytocola sp.]|uniref:hypothetical protein n=1 Tax=Actinophytocola sp. TaxID=1872138 RepID=UPI002ED47492